MIKILLKLKYLEIGSTDLNDFWLTAIDTDFVWLNFDYRISQK